jgi:hypothetical protein
MMGADKDPTVTETVLGGRGRCRQERQNSAIGVDNWRQVVGDICHDFP